MLPKAYKQILIAKLKRKKETFLTVPPEYGFFVVQTVLEGQGYRVERLSQYEYRISWD